MYNKSGFDFMIIYKRFVAKITASSKYIISISSIKYGNKSYIITKLKTNTRLEKILN